jgi:outer membrane protein
MRKYLLTWVLSAMVVMSYAQSQPKPGPKVLTFDDAVKLAVKNGLLLNQQRNNLELNAMQRKYAIAGLGPTLGINAGAQRSSGNLFVQQTGKLAVGVSDNANASLNANINLFNGFSQVNRAKQADRALDAQSFYVNRTTQDIISTVSGQYLRVLLDEELVKIANENWEAQKKLLTQIKEQVSLGAKSPVDEYNQDSQTKGTEKLALQAQINLINDRALLTQSLLMDPSEEFEVVKPDWDLSSMMTNKADLDPLVDNALKNRGDYLRAVKNEESAKYGMKAMRATMLPTLSMFATEYTAYNYFYGDAGTNPYPFDQQVKVNNLRKFVGFSLFVPIFGGNQNLQNRTNFVTQKVTYENNQWLRKNAEIQVKTDVKKANDQIQLYLQMYAASAEQLKAAEMALQLETERYTLGVTSFVEFANANRVYVQAQADKAQAEYTLLFQKVVIDYAAGTLKPEDFK